MTSGLSDEQAVYFLRRLRAARYKTLEDAEDFKTICFCLEELGATLAKKRLKGLGSCETVLLSQVSARSQTDLNVLFGLVIDARNDLAHRGVFARQTASRAVKLALMLEESLMPSNVQVSYLMSNDIVQILEFYTLEKIRELMLENSFSYLPYYKDGTYYLVSDAYVAKAWRNSSDGDKYVHHAPPRLRLKDLKRAKELCVTDDVYTASKKMNGSPAMVFDKEGEGRCLVGILTPFDLL
ncbi:hypothetical protein V3W47_02575 [Deinococcus sp. YIM 134068]|uniref:hypothetical protein n=1 Tax=Deinococcus lichenicola TaxID=3118910 RepID=UPI002F955C74